MTGADNTNLYNFFQGGGEMGRLMREKDWSKTALGTPDKWPQNLSTIVSVILENPFAMYIAWGDEFIQLYNDSFRPILGESKHPHALGNSSAETFSEIWDAINPMFDQVMKGGSVKQTDLMLTLNRNGYDEVCYFDFSYSSVRNNNGSVGGILVTVIETTHNKKAEQSLQESNQRFRNVMQQAPVGITILRGPEYIVEMANVAYLQLVDRKESEFVGSPLFASLPEVKNIVHPLLNKVLYTGQPYHGNEVPIPLVRHGKQDIFYFDFLYYPLKEEDGKITGIIVSVNEVTEKVSTRKTIEESKRLYEAITQNTPDLIYVFSTDYLFTYANEALLKMWGKSWEDAIGKGMLENGYEPWHNDMHEREIDQVIETKKPVRGEVSFPHATLGRRIYDYIFVPVLDQDGNVQAIAGTTRDITQQVESRKQIEESEIRFRQMVEQSTVPMLVIRGEEMIFEVINEPMLELIRRDASIIGKGAYEIMPELMGQSIMEKLYQTFKTGEPWTGYEQSIIINKNGYDELGYYDISYKALLENGKITGVLQSAFDVTAQVSSRKELEKAEDSLKLALRAARLGTFDLDLTKGTMEWDDRCRELFGISHHEHVSYERDFAGGLHPEDRERILKIIEKVFIKAESNGDYDVEYRTVGVEDQKIRWVRAMGKAYFDEADQPTRFIGAVLDITEIKQDEIRKNDFIGMVSHELKTPLTSLKAYVQLLQAKAENSEDKFSISALGKINNQVNRMTSLINGFLNTSRLESGKIQLNKEEFNLTELISDIIDDVKSYLPDRAIIFNFQEVIKVNADKDKIGSVITNLLSNAGKYSREGTSIVISCETCDNNAVVSVKDEGIGIKKEDAQRLFERYYRVENKESRNVSGFGIGLYLSAEIITIHRGKITVESEPGKGSTFSFSIPLH
jgi:PAS domain S-box-containing protein